MELLLPTARRLFGIIAEKIALEDKPEAIEVLCRAEVDMTRVILALESAWVKPDGEATAQAQVKNTWPLPQGYEI